MAGYTSRIRVEGATGYATPTGNVTVPLWCGGVFIMSVCPASSPGSDGFITPVISSLFPPFGLFLPFVRFPPSASHYVSVLTCSLLTPSIYSQVCVCSLH